MFSNSTSGREKGFSGHLNVTLGLLFLFPVRAFMQKLCVAIKIGKAREQHITFDDYYSTVTTVSVYSILSVKNPTLQSCAIFLPQFQKALMT